MEFKFWLEERESERNVRKMFLKRLNFSSAAMDDSSISTMRISSYKKEIIRALNNMGLDEEKIEDLKNWIKTYPEKTLQDLINQINPNDVEISDEPDTGMELPKGKKKPEKQPLQQQIGRNDQDQMYLANPPRQNSMQVPM